jgi:hypothetical protein
MDNKVSVSKVKNGDVLEKLRMAFIIDRVSLIKSFKDIGIIVKDEKDLYTLYKLNSEGLDRKGLKSDNGKIVKLDINSFLDKVHLRNEFVKNCNIVFVD